MLCALAACHCFSQLTSPTYITSKLMPAPARVWACWGLALCMGLHVPQIELLKERANRCVPHHDTGALQATQCSGRLSSLCALC